MDIAFAWWLVLLALLRTHSNGLLSPLAELRNEESSAYCIDKLLNTSMA